MYTALLHMEHQSVCRSVSIVMLNSNVSLFSHLHRLRQVTLLLVVLSSFDYKVHRGQIRNSYKGVYASLYLHVVWRYIVSSCIHLLSCIYLWLSLCSHPPAQVQSFIKYWYFNRLVFDKAKHLYSQRLKLSCFSQKATILSLQECFPPPRAPNTWPGWPLWAPNFP